MLWKFVPPLLILLVPASMAMGEELTIALVPELNVFRQMTRYRPLGSYLRERTGVEIRFTILPRHGSVVDRFASGKIDGAFWGSFTGALAIRMLGAEPIARPLRRDGTSTDHGLLFARRDSGIRSMSDMKGKVMAFVDRATASGFLFQAAYLRKRGARDLDAFFAEYYFAGSHDAAIAAVLDGHADIGCAKSTVFRRVASRDPRVDRDLSILAETPRVPSSALGLRRGLDPATVEALRKALLTMANDPDGRQALDELGAIRFIPTAEEDYASLFELTKSAGVDPKSHPFVTP